MELFSWMSHSVIHSRGTGLTRTAGSLLNFSLLVTIQSAASVFFFRQHLFACCQASFLPAGPGTRKHAPHYFCSLFSSFLLQGLFFNIPGMSCLFFFFVILYYQLYRTWAQEGCEPELNSEEEGSILLSMFPGCNICCNEFCGCSDALRRCCLLLPSRCSRAEELWGRLWLRWLAFELAPWVCGLPWKRRRPIKMSSHSTMNNNTLPVQKLNMVLVGS